MKFDVSSKTLSTTVSAVSKVINSKNAMAILYNFLFTLEGDTLTVTASDVENTLTASVKVNNPEGEGRVCVDARRMVELLKELPDVEIHFDIEEGSLAINISYPGSTFSLVGINGDEYPSNDSDVAADARLEFTVPSSRIVKGIENTIFAVGTDDLRPQMMGILWDIKPDSIIFVATDTRKLVRYIDSKMRPDVEGSCILPTKPANVLRNVLGAAEEVTVIIEPKSATFVCGHYRFNCRFIKGNFPPYDRVIPKDNPYTITVDRQLLLNAVRRVAVFVDPGHGLIKFRLSHNKMELKAQDNSFCTFAHESVDCDFAGNDMVIGFSAPYLIEILNTLNTQNILISLSDPSRPGVFLPDENPEGTDLLMLLMPMTVSEF